MNRNDSITPVWLIFLVDISLCVCSLFAAYLLRFNFSIPDKEVADFSYVFPLVLALKLFAFVVFQPYRGILRFTSTSDVQRVLLAILAANALLICLNPISLILGGFHAVPFSIILIDALVSSFFLISFRLGVQYVLEERLHWGKEKASVIIVGSGDTAIMAQRAIERDAGARYRVVAFIDNTTVRQGKKIQNVKIYPEDRLFQKLEKGSIKLVILAQPDISAEFKHRIIEQCLASSIKVFTVPPVGHWINGDLSFKQIKKINVNDLLDREIIDIHIDSIRRELAGKRVLVTGAAGSIGAELVRQIIAFEPQQLILLDQAESPLYELERELMDEMGFSNFEIVVGDIRMHSRMDNLFRTYTPEYVFHAAAYKHVPLMEKNPSEALLTNIKGTKVMADLSDAYGVHKFVMVSTDKAVKPTNVMGASKRVAEIYVQSLNKISKTRFITTRFGNVLGSNGSVIPILTRQIERGGPITITHPEITRYFMTIREACLLVLEAGAYGEGGEILIFDMGESVKIKDLVEKMVKLSGLTLGKDISIKYTGLRPGEKLYEELLNDKENTVKTHHSRIMKALVQDFEFAEIAEKVSALIPYFEQQNNVEIVKRMKQLVPEYISKNSEFEDLDQHR
jgi:FlaA1/EpsC-like NDP-sugar epimerase